MSRPLAPCRAFPIAIALGGWALPAGAQEAPAAAPVTPVTPAPITPPAPQPPAVQSPANDLDPNSPMAPLPGLGVDWPAIAAAPAPAPGAAGAIANADRNQRYTLHVEGLAPLDDASTDRSEEAAALTARFDALSALRKDRKTSANLAQVGSRTRDDAQLLTDLLRADGYYDATVETRIEPAGAGLSVTLTAAPGALYRFGAVRVTGLGQAGAEAATLDAAFPVKAGDPVDAQKVNDAVAALKVAAGRRGFPFAKVPDPLVTVDHATHTATLAMAVDTGAASRFGAIRVTGKPPFSAAHVQQIARFRPGDRYDAAMLEDLRRALVATALVSSVKLTAVPGARTGVVDVVADIQPAPPRTIAAELGYGTGEGATLSLSWQHRNLLPPEGAVTFSGVLGTREQSLGTILRRSNYRARDQVLTAQVQASHSNLNAYNAKSLLASVALERQTNIIWQKAWSWSLGTEFEASDERALSSVNADGATRRTYLVGAIPLTLAYDGTDDLLNPTRSWRISGRLSPEASFLHGTDGYARTQLDMSGYQPIGDRVVLAGRIRLGSIFGISTDGVAPSRRFYSGGGGSVRGYGYQDIGPRGADNDPIGGRSIAEFGSEVRIRFGDFGVVPFLDGGNIWNATLPRFTHFRYGAGAGVRYYTSFGPIRFDVGTPLNPQKGDSRIAVYVSLGQAF